MFDIPDTPMGETSSERKRPLDTPGWFDSIIKALFFLFFVLPCSLIYIVIAVIVFFAAYFIASSL